MDSTIYNRCKLTVPWKFSPGISPQLFPKNQIQIALRSLLWRVVGFARSQLSRFTTGSRYFQQFQDFTVKEHNRMVHLRNTAAYQMKQLTADKTGFILLSAWMDVKVDVTGLNFTKQNVYTMCRPTEQATKLLSIDHACKDSRQIVALIVTWFSTASAVLRKTIASGFESESAARESPTGSLQ